MINRFLTTRCARIGGARISLKDFAAAFRAATPEAAGWRRGRILAGLVDAGLRLVIDGHNIAHIQGVCLIHEPVEDGRLVASR